MTEFLEHATLAMLGVAALLSLGRVARGGSLPDKVLGADTLILVVACGIAAGAGVTGAAFYLDALIVVTALGFVGTITVARYVERRGARA
jgi:multicomponent Na+:H+ antiporter subunit F